MTLPSSGPVSWCFFIVLTWREVHTKSAHSPGSDSFCDWPRVDGKSLTEETFRREYLEKVPIILTNLIDDWPAKVEERWSKASLLKNFGNYTWDTSHVEYNCRKLNQVKDGTTLTNLLQEDGGPASWFVQPHHPMLREMHQRKDWNPPSPIAFITSEGPFVSIGRKSQGNIFHAHSHNWLAQVYGRKRWLVTPPGADPAPAEAAWRSHVGPCGPRPTWKNLTGCVCNPGEVVYLPSFYRHETCFLDEFNVGVAYIGSADLGENNFWAKADAGDLKQLQDGGASPTATNSKDELLLHRAAFHGHLEIADWILANHPNPKAAVTHPREDGSHPSHLAVHWGHVPVLDTMIKHGASMGTPDKNGMVASQWAAARGHSGVLRYLQNSTALVKKTLLEKHEQSGMTALHFAAGNGHAGCVKFLLKSRAKHSSAAQEGMQPLHAAAKDGHGNVVSLLIEMGAKRNAEMEDEAGSRSVHLAAREGHAPVLQALATTKGKKSDKIKLSKIIEASDKQGNLPAHLAASNGHVKALEFLAQLRADLGQGDKQGMQALHSAASNGHALVISSLANLKVDLEAPAGPGMTPLIMAAGGDMAAAVEALLEVRADPKTRDPQGKTALDYAKQFENAAVLEVFRKRGEAGERGGKNSEL